MAFLVANARWIAGGFLLTFFSSFGQTFFISIWSAEIRAEFGLSHGGFGALYMLATLGSAATLPFLGRLIDASSVRGFAVATMAMLTAATLLMAFSTNVVVLVVAIYGLRLFGQGLMTHTAMTAMGRWFVANRGRAVSFATVGHQAGEALLPSVFIAVATFVTWRQGWLVAALLIAFVALPAIATLVSSERRPEGDGAGDDPHRAGRQWTRHAVLHDPAFWLLALGVMVPPFVGTSIFFHQSYLIELNGWDPTVYYGGFAIMAATTTVFALLTGLAVDRFGAVAVLPAFSVPLALACATLGFFEAELAAIVFMFFLGVSYGISSTLFGALWPEVYGTRHLGAVRSVVVAMMVFFTAAGPGLTGWLIDAGIPFPAQLRWLALYCVAVTGLMLWIVPRLQERVRIEVRPAAL